MLLSFNITKLLTTSDCTKNLLLAAATQAMVAKAVGGGGFAPVCHYSSNRQSLWLLQALLPRSCLEEHPFPAAVIVWVKFISDEVTRCVVAFNLLTGLSTDFLPHKAIKMEEAMTAMCRCELPGLQINYAAFVPKITLVEPRCNQAEEPAENQSSVRQGCWQEWVQVVMTFNALSSMQLCSTSDCRSSWLAGLLEIGPPEWVPPWQNGFQNFKTE